MARGIAVGSKYKLEKHLQNDEARSCDDVFERIKENYKLWRSPVIMAFRSMYKAINAADNERSSTLDLDKLVLKCQHVIKSQLMYKRTSNSFQFLAELFQCREPTSGQGFLMKFVRLGLKQSLVIATITGHFDSPHLHLLRDSAMNNLLHLAVYSGNSDILSIVISSLRIPASEMIEMFNTENAEGQRALDIAVSKNIVDLTYRAQQYYMIFSAASSLGERSLPTSLLETKYDETSCYKYMIEIHDKKEYLYTPISAGLHALIFAIVEPERFSQKEQENLEKIVTRSSDIIQRHLINYSLTSWWRECIDKLKKCSLNQAHHTIFARLVISGMLDTMDLHNILFVENFASLMAYRDISGNNIVHLAVMSRNERTMSNLLALLSLEGHNNVFKSLKEKNLEEYTPLDLAISLKERPMARLLQAYYSSYMNLDEGSD